VKVQESPIGCENSWSQRVIEKLNNHEGSPRVTREMNGHPIFYIYTLIAHAKAFSPCLLLPGIREENNYFGGGSGGFNAPLLGLSGIHCLDVSWNFCLIWKLLEPTHFHV